MCISIFYLLQKSKHQHTGFEMDSPISEGTFHPNLSISDPSLRPSTQKQCPGASTLSGASAVCLMSFTGVLGLNVKNTHTTGR